MSEILGQEQQNGAILKKQATNVVFLKGRLISLTTGQTKTGVDYVNFYIETIGEKYTDNVPCVAYGEMASRILNGGIENFEVQAKGRIRTRTAENGKCYVSAIIVNSINKKI